MLRYLTRGVKPQHRQSVSPTEDIDFDLPGAPTDIDPKEQADVNLEDAMDQKAIAPSIAESKSITDDRSWLKNTLAPSPVEHQRSAPKPSQDGLAENKKLSRDIVHLQNQLDKASDDRRYLQNELNRATGDCDNLQSEYRRVSRKFQSDFHHLTAEHCNLQQAHVELGQQHNDLMQKYAKKVKHYEELDMKYMDLVRNIRVTGDDHFTINKKLSDLRYKIETLVRKAKGQNSINLNRDAFVQLFRDSELLRGFPVQEHQWESLHINLFMEANIMCILSTRLFARPLHCIFDGSAQFEEICNWMGSRDSNMMDRWRQQLCILIAQNAEEMASRKEKEVARAREELEVLISSIYQNVDMSDVVKELCNFAFDLSYAMYGMESRIYPAPIALGVPFNEEEMTMALKSNPTGSVSLVIFPAFQDSSREFYVKPKVWCF